MSGQVEPGPVHLLTAFGLQRLIEATVVRWESGETETGPQPWIRPKLARVLQVSVGQLDELLVSEPADESASATAVADAVVVRDERTAPPSPAPNVKGFPDLHRVELLRQGLNDALSEGTMAEAGLDDWERTVIRYGRATRDRPAGVLLDDLSADLNELKRALHRHRSASALRRLTRLAAHMSGLMCLTFCKLDD